jgi:hypothetical protein
MGTNFFVPLPVVMPGAMGAQAPIDLFGLVPPTGLDRHLTFTCDGDFVEGTIAIECSPDDPMSPTAIWSVLEQFDSGLDADNVSGPSLELSPIVIDATVRALRLNVQTRTKIRGPVVVSVAGEQNCPCGSLIALSCCPCAIPLNVLGIPDPSSFCADFPDGVINPFDEAVHSIDFTRTTSGDDTILEYGGNASSGALFLLSPTPVVIPDNPGSFCFCAVLAQDVVLPGTPANPIGGSYAGLISGPFDQYILVTTVDPLTSQSYATYQIIFFNVTGPSQFIYDTGIPINGVLHKFTVCRGLGLSDYFITLDSGAPVQVDPAFSIGNMSPFIGINVLGPDAIGNPFALRVDSFCTSSLIAIPN